MRTKIEGIIMDMASMKERMSVAEYPSDLEADYKRSLRKLKRLWKLQAVHRLLDAQIENEIGHEHSPSVEADTFHEPVDPLDRDVDNSTVDVLP